MMRRLTPHTVRLLAASMAWSVGWLTPLPAHAAGLPFSSDHVTTLATCALVSYPGTSTTSTANMVDSLLTGNVGNTAATTFRVNAGTVQNQRVYVQFSIGNCLFAPPAGAIVRTATLRMYATALPGACRTYDIFKAGSAWSETTLTWNNQPAGTAINNPPTGSRTSFLQAGPAGCANPAVGYLGWSVTADVASFVTTPSSNHGWEIRDDAEGNLTGGTLTLATRKMGVVTQAPQLLISYTLV